jgi:hypothetical protein
MFRKVSKKKVNKESESFAVGSANLIDTNILSKNFTAPNYSQPMMFTQRYAVGGEVEQSSNQDSVETHGSGGRKTQAQINSLDFSNYDAKN